MIHCEDCKAPLEWTGRGRKPKRCKPCGAEANRKKATVTKIRDRKHREGRAASKWGDLWLVDGKPVRRDRRQVWGGSADQSGTLMVKGGIFLQIGAIGLPNEGISPNDPGLQGEILSRVAEIKNDPDAKAWLEANPDWWRIEEWAHGTLSHFVTDSVVVHGETTHDNPDETSNKHRCSFCCERKPLVLVDEFCSESCFTDYVRTFGPDGIDFEKLVLPGETELLEAA